MKKRWKCEKRYVTFTDGRRLYDYQVASFAWKHMKFFDRFSIEKFTTAVLVSFVILQSESIDPDFNHNDWKFEF